ncbi:hypothetical protein IM660_01375 [Ruania alkalisoli]|uniref:AMIN-like domain-containing protein n=1 Tax=Ruania alkalisoli TaxID=2779775 RepID=A0A7M1STU4_9MICO|nr:hypothetical protein [Ruania alkalisoli]QOR70996.1 hypothetical protein IM660_01375 [Ruania alkalisoli]
MRRTRHLVMALGLAFVAAGCTESDDSARPTASSTSAPSSTPADDGTETAPQTPHPHDDEELPECRSELTYADEDELTHPTSAEDFLPYDSRAAIQEQSGRYLVLSDLRVGVHNGYERLVAEFTTAQQRNPDPEPTQPGLNAAYITCASPSEAFIDIPIEGRDILGVGINGAARRINDNGFVPPPDAELPGTTITDVEYVGAPGGSASLFIGVGHERADFRVFSLTDPYRVVVDIAHPD